MRTIFYILAMAGAFGLAGCGPRQPEQAKGDELPVAEPLPVGGTPASPAAQASRLELPRLALACGGDGHRNIRLVFDPAQQRVILASAIDEKGWISSEIGQVAGGLHILFQGSLDHPTREMVFKASDLTYQENSNYSPTGPAEAEACLASIREAEADCAEAANIGRCMEIRHPEAAARSVSGSCMITAPRWQAFQCDAMDEADYEAALEEASGYGLYDF